MFDVMKSLSVIFRAWLAAILLAMLLISCSSSTRPGGGGGGGGQTQEPVLTGMQRCFTCHYAEATDKWLAGAHGNNESANPLDAHPDFPGLPSYSDVDWQASCEDCHDPLGDGELLNDFWIATGIDDYGTTNRPVIGCESCHGDATQHADASGLIAPPEPMPDYAICEPCHNSEFTQDANHDAEANNIYDNYTASLSNGDIISHVNSIEVPNYVIYGNPASGVQALCSKCHTDEGAKLYKEVSGGHDALEASLGGLAPVAGATVVQCRTCHDAHNPSELLLAASGGESAEYRTCSACHQNNGSFGLADAYHGESSGYSWGLPAQPPDEDFVDGDYFNPGEIIYDTHFDDPATADVIEGYNLGPITINGNFGLASERICRDCHNVHAAGNIINDTLDETINTINKQWARSAHAGHIAAAKEAASEAYTYPDDAPTEILKAGVQETDEDAPGFSLAYVFFDWDDTFNKGVDGLGGDGERGECQRCHTATGAKNYLNGPLSYNFADNDFSHLAGWTWNVAQTENATSSGQNELLYCWGCHADNSGTLRAPGPVTAEFATTPFPDLLGSNVCIACHAGLESGDDIENSLDDADQFDTKEFINSHYLAAGSIIFTTIGYQFKNTAPGLDYSNPAGYQHGSQMVQAGNNGPCIGCHMQSDTSHLFLAVEKDGTGVITAVTTYAQTCSQQCHAEYASETDAVDELNALSAGYWAALDVLKNELANRKGFYFDPAYPYFFNVGLPIYPNRITDWDPDDDGTGRDNMGAAFNYNLLYHEPGAYVHNQLYARRLIFDSINYLVDGVLDGTIDLTGYLEAAIYLSGNPLVDVANVPRP